MGELMRSLRPPSRNGGLLLRGGRKGEGREGRGPTYKGESGEGLLLGGREGRKGGERGAEWEGKKIPPTPKSRCAVTDSRRYKPHTSQCRLPT